MERKTKVHAEEGKQEIRITREFDLPLPLLFKAYADRPGGAMDGNKSAGT